ncbi:hypothetical protein BGX30_007442, partial [Mortierella sp. GBA39]
MAGKGGSMYKKNGRGSSRAAAWLRNWQLYLLIAPVLGYFIIFHYIPMYGVQIAFKDYIASKGITGSPW